MGHKRRGNRKGNPNGPQRGDTVRVDLDRLSFEGPAVGRLPPEPEKENGRGLVVFARGGAPGETVDAEITWTQRRHVEARVKNIITPSPVRVPERCGHIADGCGGCSWQHINYAAQLDAKTQIVKDALTRIGGFDAEDIEAKTHPTLGAPDPFFYRTKMEFAFHPESGLGLHKRGAWDQVIPLEECHLQSELSVNLVKVARKFAQDNNISAWDPHKKQGTLREFVVRHAKATKETMVGIITEDGPFPEGAAMAAHLAGLDANVVSVVRGIRAGDSDGAPIAKVDPLWGRDHIVEELLGQRFRIRLGTFSKPTPPRPKN